MKVIAQPDSDRLELIRKQYAEFSARNSPMGRAECEEKFPDLIQYIRERVSLVDIIRNDGFELKPLSPDAPDIFIVKGGCPSCHQNIFIRSGSN